MGGNINTIEMPGMSEDLTHFLEDLTHREWEVSVKKIKESELEEAGLVRVEVDGNTMCVDGRLVKNEGGSKNLHGPKIQGGAAGVAALQQGEFGEVGEKEIRSACQSIKDSGYSPAVHDLHHDNEPHCGFVNKWLQGLLRRMPRLLVKSSRIAEIVEKEFGGFHAELADDHVEEGVRANLVSGTTFEPDRTHFNVDLWYASEVGIETMRMAESAIDTVEALNGKRVLELYLPA